MGVFSVPVTIGVDEERIAKSIEKNVESQVVNVITERVESLIHERTWGDRYNSRDLSPLKEMIVDVVERIVQEHEDYIIQNAISALSSKLLRKKITQNMLEQGLIEMVK